MTNEELARQGFELCEMSGECDFCFKEAQQGEYFWKSTSYETIEGDYWCRECATKCIEELSGYDEWLDHMIQNKDYPTN